MAREDRFWRALAAAFVAWMLVLQSLTAALAIGSVPQAGVDGPAAVLCSGDVLASQPSDPGDQRACCALGCMSGVAAGIPPSGDVSLNASFASYTATFDAASQLRRTGSAHPGAERSRAPPATV